MLNRLLAQHAGDGYVLVCMDQMEMNVQILGCLLARTTGSGTRLGLGAMESQALLDCLSLYQSPL